jgi:hypothetical protein
VGEAKRRKLAGTYPQPDDPLAAARRFWCGRDPGHVEDFRCPEGLLAITLDVAGVAPTTFLMDAAKITDLAADIERRMSRGRLAYYTSIRAIADQFAKAKRAAQPDAAMQWIGPLALWSALHHPQAGALVRVKVSTALRNEGRADKFFDLDAFIAHAPRDQVFACVGADDREQPKDRN